MKVFCCLVLIALVSEISAKSIQEDLDEEALLQEVREFLQVEHDEGVGKAYSRILETRGSSTQDTIPVKAGGKVTNLSLKDAALKAHNLCRALHGVKDLIWSDDLAKSSQKHADVLAAQNKLFHSTGKYGENVGFKAISIKPTKYSPAFTIFSWWFECEKYKYEYGKPDSQSGTGHFTQVVWETTTHVGCAMATNTQGSMDSTFLVCQYTPPGNYAGQYAQNVHKLKKSGSGPKKALDIAIEGCVDYSTSCSTYSSLCKSNPSVADTCCSTCK